MATMRKFLATLFIWFAVSAAQADSLIYVVVNTKLGVSEISQREVAEIYLGRSKVFPNGQYARPIDYADPTPLKVQFYKDLVNRDLAVISAYRVSLRQTQSPIREVRDIGDVLNMLRDNPLGIAYLPAPPNDPLLRVVLTLPAR